MEVVRRDWTELAKDVQRELYKRLFAGEPVEGYLADITTSLRKGELDHKLVYRKGLKEPGVIHGQYAPTRCRSTQIV